MSTGNTLEANTHSTYTEDYVHVGSTPAQVVGLASHAALPPSAVSIFDVKHHVSNDDLATKFSQVQSRELTRSYRQVENKTAVLIGESALMAAIRYMPEETILMLDKSPAMVAYIARYVAALRTSGDIEEWYENMGFNNPPDIRHEMAFARLRTVTREQAGFWRQAGHEHPALSADAFAEASELAKQKVIVPWRADIGDGRDMSRLGKILRAHRAGVTMLNLTNVLVCDSRFKFAHQAADQLVRLPTTPEVPILTTTAADYDVNETFPVSHPARLFLGLEDLRLNGGATDVDSPVPGPAITKVIRT